MTNDSWKDPSPKDRTKKLKKLEEEKKKELEEAVRLIKERTEERAEEISARVKLKEKVPIPEVAKEDWEGLSEGAKEILKLHRGLVERKESEEETKPAGQPQEKESLEETLRKEKTKEFPPEIFNSDYAGHLSLRPMQELKKEMMDIYQTVKEKDYISKEEERRIEYLSSAVERKLEDVERGSYSLTADVAQAASLTQQVGSSLKYQLSSAKKNKMYQT